MRSTPCARAAISSVTLLGRRGPVQAAFTTPELRELGELERADVVVDATDLALDDHSLAALENEASPTTKRNIAVLQDFAARAPATRAGPGRSRCASCAPRWRSSATAASRASS